ncbi:MerR family transcriptional regulator [Nocardiopsis alba]|uniref:MerR family transcriptional regulator n=1 Tax=Nocardiopsis alba TaxID=53437 RepID=UPI001F4D27C6|nr:MerR family transcriptional regulator [Nocardiopsis alba]
MTSASRDEMDLLRVGDLSELTGVNTRLLRYYENQGLIRAERSTGGHRLFDPAVVEQVRSVRLLLAAGLPTRVIGELLECINDPDRFEPCAVPTLMEHLVDYDERIASLVGTRDTLQRLIDASTGARA